MSMPDVELVPVAARLAKLENENRRLKRIVAATAMLSLVSILIGVGTLIRPGIAQENSGGLETIQASGWGLRDSQGRVRAQLFFSDAKGSPMLAFNDAEGRSRLIISADEQSTSIVAYSPNGGRFQSESVASLDGAMVESSRMQKGAPEARASLSAFKEFTSMTAEDERGFRIIVGNASIQEKPGQEIEQTSAASVVMYRKGGHVIWQAPPRPPQRLHEGAR